MSQLELLARKEFLGEDLFRGFMKASSSPGGGPMLFIEKSDGSLRPWVDYPEINQLSIKIQYPVPLIKETLVCLAKAMWYTKLDLWWGYHQIRSAVGEEWKTAFGTRYGRYQWNVMPFCLTNAPATFEHFINETVGRSWTTS